MRAPTLADAEALGSLLLLALAALFVAASALLFVPLAFALTLAGALLFGGQGVPPLVPAIAALLFLASWNCALATETFGDPASGRVAWLALRTLALVAGCWWIAPL